MAESVEMVAACPSCRRDCVWRGSPTLNAVNQAGDTTWVIDCPVYCLGRTVSENTA